jgi:hypothetical protein
MARSNGELNERGRCANCVLLIAFFIGINYRSSLPSMRIFLRPAIGAERVERKIRMKYLISS